MSALVCCCEYTPVIPAKAGIYLLFLFLDNTLIEIIPISVHFFNELYLPGTIPFFHVLLSLNRIFYVVICLIIYEFIKTVAFTKSVNYFILMFPYPLWQIARNTNIEYLLVYIRDNIYKS